MQYFIPADTAPRLSVLPTAFQVMPPSVARVAIEQHTRPGDVILDPFASGLGVIQAALDLGRKVIAASFNPVNALAIRATLWPSDARSAFTHLEDALKVAQRLNENVLKLFTTKCPTCGQASIVQHFIWDRERHQPVEKHVNCAVCGENIGLIEDDDLKDFKKLDPRGLPFWLLHGRVIDRGHEDADRVNDVLDVYTPRVQSVLSDILLKFEALSDEDRSALRPALLATLDACTSLHTPDEARYPSGLKPPPRFIEKNVWLELERQVSLLPVVPRILRRVATVDELFAADAPAVCLLVSPARELIKRLPERSIPLVVTHPPLPRPGFWSLSAVWAAWLWGKNSSMVDHLLPLLSRKRTSWDWQWRAIGSALNVLHPAWCQDARVVMNFPAEEAALDSVALAAASARLVAEHMVCDPHDGVRATWRVGDASGTSDASSASADSESIIEAILHDRGEPTHEITLRTGLLAALGQTSMLADIAQRPEGEQTPSAILRGKIDQAFNTGSIFEIDPHRKWLTRPRALSTPLADAVERRVRDLLRECEDWSSDELLRQLYQSFPDQLTPDRALVATVIHSYAEDLHLDRIRLRAEDSEEARAAESAEVRRLLLTLGERLGLKVSDEEEQQRIVWSQARKTVYAFVVQTTAEVVSALRAETGVLVIPGGRATLLQHKFARDARLRQTQWQVLKFSSLRRAAQQADLSLDTFPFTFGLEPPIEQPAMQIQLL